jgi:hypothetical protein
VRLRHGRPQETFTVSSDKARQRAEQGFKKEERTHGARKAVMEYERQAVTTREKTARLKELRLAKEVENGR